MLPFRSGPGAAFTCEADLWADPYFALNFHDGDCAGIPFHLSLRRHEGVVVVNRQDLAGWRREVVTPWRFDAARLRIETRFSRGQVTVALGGVPLGRFDRFPRPMGEGRFFLRRGFPDLGRIGHVSWTGAMVPDSLVLTDPVRQISAQGTGLAVSDRMEAIWAGLDADAAYALERAGLVLQVDGLEAGLAMTCTPLPYRNAATGAAREHALQALLPGRIWAGGADRVCLRLVDKAGREHQQALFGRDDLRRTVERLGAHARLRHDGLAALQALEHVRHAGLLTALSPPARAALQSGRRSTGWATGWQAKQGQHPWRLPLRHRRQRPRTAPSSIAIWTVSPPPCARNRGRTRPRSLARCWMPPGWAKGARRCCWPH